MYQLYRASLAALMLIFLLASRVVMAAASFSQQPSTGWLSDFNHPPVAVQMQLTGASDPLAKTVNALLQVQLQGQWKTYWRSPGDGGAAPQFDFAQSQNISDIVWAWPAPQRYSVAGVDTLGYQQFVNFPLTLQLQDISKAALLKGTLTIASCTNLCVLSDYEIELPFTPNGLVVNEQAAAIYQRALDSVPVKLQQGSRQRGITAWNTHWDNEQQLLSVDIERDSAWQTPDIFIDSNTDAFSGVTFAAPEVSLSGNSMTAQIAVSSWNGKLDLHQHALNLTVVDQDLAVELPSTPVQPDSFKGVKTLASMFVIALLGGLILNIMPCVLPVLGMKLSSILGAGSINRRQIRRQFIASSAGILSSFWLLAAFLLMIKFSGQALGWGIQFQSPYFIGLMVVITALFAANMLDLYHIQLPSSAQTWLATKGGHSYLQGMFATLLATPCSAPFVGTAVAFSFAASAWQLLIIFTALGLGMALPWLLIALFPGMAQCLPKPGKWMNALKTFFALLILMTCYWLISLLSSFIGPSLTLLLALLLSALLLLFIAKKHGRRQFIMVCSVIVLSTAGLLLLNKASSNGGNRLAANQHWQSLDRAAIEQQVQQGKVVFVDITADWCVTCKANKLGVLLQEPVYSLLQTANIIAMRGDWTQDSDTVSEYLQFYQRFAVPFNMVYGPNAAQGIPLPTILTTNAVLDAIEQAK